MGGTSRHERTVRGDGQRGARGGKSGGGIKQPPSREVVVSKALSFLLRHGARGEGIELDDGGWASLADVLQWRRLSAISVTLAEIQELVATNDKQRFALKPDPSYQALPTSPRPSSSSNTTAVPSTQSTDPCAYLIRASQGHSLKTISSEKLLTPLFPSDPAKPALVVHGTYPSPWEWIQKSGGLKPMTRRHIHFATNLPSALPPLSPTEPLKVPNDWGVDVVVSGMRRDATVLIWVDMRKSAAAGVKWWKSQNGVVLTEGLEGILGMEFFAWVERRGTGQVLYGTKPEGGAAALGVQEGDEEGVSREGAGHSQVEVERGLDELKVDENKRKIAESTDRKKEAPVELKDNWDD